MKKVLLLLLMLFCGGNLFAEIDLCAELFQMVFEIQAAQNKPNIRAADLKRLYLKAVDLLGLGLGEYINSIKFSKDPSKNQKSLQELDKLMSVLFAEVLKAHRCPQR